MADLPYSYVVTDMDGTLLSPDHLLSDFTKQTLTTLVKDKGVMVIMASGRNFFDVSIVNDNLQKFMKDTHDNSSVPRTYLITSNGAITHDAAAKEVVQEHYLDPKLAEELYYMLPDTEQDINSNIYQYDEWFARWNWPEMNDYHKESGLRFKCCPHPPSFPTDDAAALYENGSKRLISDGCFEGILKVFFITRDIPKLHAFAEKLKQKYGPEVISTTFSGDTCFEAMSVGVSKGAAIRHLLTELHKGDAEATEKALARVVSFGDSLNDQEMLLTTGKGYLMGNSSQMLRDACPTCEMIGCNAEDGVAKKLCEIFKIQP